MKKTNHVFLILMLGSLTALGPFTIDMYLSAFPQMAHFFQTSVAQVSMTLSSYFVGLASGQLVYGVLMDRFGRKKPLYAGLIFYIVASIACALSPNIEILIFFRFLQGLGACAASVAAFAMVRDLFTPQESTKVLSLLILILGVSPLLAPTIGGFLAVHFSWSVIFYVLAGIALTILLVISRFLPESHHGDKTHVLKPMPIIRNYLSIIKEPQFYAFALSGATAFAGLFAYLASSPTIFMEIFKVTEAAYGWIFAIIAMGIVGMSQFNVPLVKRFKSEKILIGAFLALLSVSLVFCFCAYHGYYNLYSVILTLFLFLACIGLSNPNSAALAMAPFGKKAGSAAALMGFLQMVLGALASLGVSLLKAQTLLPISILFVVVSSLALIILALGMRQIENKIEVSGEHDMGPAH